jgi:hypothetical protein
VGASWLVLESESADVDGRELRLVEVSEPVPVNSFPVLSSLPISEGFSGVLVRDTVTASFVRVRVGRRVEVIRGGFDSVEAGEAASLEDRPASPHVCVENY